MKKLNVIILSAAVIFVSFSTLVSADDDAIELELTYTFKYPIIEKSKIIIPEAEIVGNPGEPAMPSVVTNILIPFEKKIDKISVTVKEKIKLGDDFDIQPVDKVVPTSDLQLVDTVETKKDDRIYTSDQEFPGRLFSEIGTYSFRGYIILVLELFPVQYNPVTGEAFFYKSMEITVKTVNDHSKNSLIRERDKNEVIKKVDNPKIIDTYRASRPLPLRDDYDLLILTTDALKNSFIPLKQAHDGDGVSTVIKTLSDVGGTTPEDIRDYIRDMYNDFGIEYVLLGGDSNVIPVKKLWAEVNGGDTTDHVPSDVYYACLDGPYNYDGDNKWGEPNDGEGGGDVDLLAEVYVGRACVGTTNEVDNFVDKTLAYMDYSENDEYLGKILMVGEQLDSYTWGGDSMEALVSYAISEDLYYVDRLYEKDGGWSASQLIGKIEANVHMINHLGHSNTNYNMKLDNSQVDVLQNEKLCFVYTQGCYPGAFDQGDCIAEHFTIKTQHAAFAGVFNARYGWYSPGSTNGLSQRFHKSFVKGLFEENQGTIGKTNHYSKEYYINSINSNGMRWCFYQTNLFGDPSLSFYLQEGPEPNIEIGAINGGLFISFVIKNTGTNLAEDVSWNMTVKGGLLNLIDVTIDDDCEPIGAGNQTTIQLTRVIVGLGTVNITVNAKCSTGDSDTKNVDGKVFIISTKIAEE